jgi:ferredoxin--NADP+ reductase
MDAAIGPADASPSTTLRVLRRDHAVRGVAIIGSGPAGLYTADLLSRAEPSVHIDVIERLPFPFGLVRYGVAPDHETTRNVTQVFARIFARPGVQFHGNIDVGRDVSFSEIQQRYDAVVIATGVHRGECLDVPGLDRSRVVAAYDLARWFNGHPDLAGLTVRSGLRAVCIIGNGNVSLDMARMLAKSPEELRGSDVSEPALAWLNSHHLHEIHIIGRRGAGETRFAPSELAELRKLERFQPIVADGDCDPPVVENAAALAVLQSFVPDASAAAKRSMTFHFDATPRRCQGGTLELSSRGRAMRLNADLVVCAIGQSASTIPGLPLDERTGMIEHSRGVVARLENTFVVGWVARPGDGTIANARSAAKDLVAKIVQCLRESRVSSRPMQFSDICSQNSLRRISWEDWQRIDRYEVDAGKRRGKNRHKIIERQSIAHLLNTGADDAHEFRGRRE